MMKNLVSLYTVFVMLTSAVLPGFAQKSHTEIKQISKVRQETARFASLDAISDGKGALVSWTMEFERENVGFNVYRFDVSGLNLVSPSIIVGSKGAFGTQAAYGEQYSFFDVDGQIGSSYVIEAISVKGRGGRSDAVTSVYVKDIEASIDRMIPERHPQAKPRLDRSDLELPLDLKYEVLKNENEPNRTVQEELMAQGGVKLGIKADGLYRVTRAELQAAGFDVNSDPANWQLFGNGVEQAINVEPTGQYIEFLGKAIETVESDIRSYFLISGASAGKRVASRVARPFGGSSVSPNYLQSYFKKERSVYIYSILNGDAENYWGNVVSGTQRTFTFNLSGVDLNIPTATLQIKFQGFSATAHTVAMSINGNALAPAGASGIIPFSKTLEVPTSALLEGQNTLAMTSGGSGDFSLFDSIRVDYRRKYSADQNQTWFYTSNYRSARVTGFASANIRVFDTTLDGEPLLLTNLSVTPNGPTFDVNLPAARGRVMYAVEDSAVKQVPSITMNYPSSLATAAHDAKLVIITHRNFLAEGETWANYRRNATFTAEVVDVEDIFDEFNFGQSSSASISSFLNYAMNNWSVPPQYVLLLGDGSYDPKNYNGFGNHNLIPPKMVNTVYSEAPSDEALADFNNDGLAELAIGRIPARLPIDVTNAIGKVMAFEQPVMQDLNRGAVFAYDVPDGFDFAAMSSTLRSQLPGTMPATMVPRGLPQPNEMTVDPNAHTNLMNALNGGRYIVNYSGHGSAGVWAHTAFFGVNDVPFLTNANTQSIFTMLTCLNGYFIRPDFDSLSEKLLKATNGGSVVSWASTGLTTPDIQLIMGTRFYNQVGEGTITRMGDLVRDAKSALPGSSDVRFSWALIGDPMLKIH